MRSATVRFVSCGELPYPPLCTYAEHRHLFDHFVVTAYAVAHFKLVNNRALQVEVTNKSTRPASPKNAGTQVTLWGEYPQRIGLPTAVKTEQMKIDHQSHELLITLPIAASVGLDTLCPENLGHPLARGQSNDEGRTGTELAVHLDLSTVSLHDGLDETEPKPQSTLAPTLI